MAKKTVRGTVRQNVYRANRKTLFDDGEVKISLTPSGRKEVAVLEVERRQSERPSKFVLCWTASITFEGDAVVVTASAPSQMTRGDVQRRSDH